METAVLPLPVPAGHPDDGWQEWHWPSAEDWHDADLVLAFLAPSPHLEATLAALGHSFPRARIAGCEAVTRFRDGHLAEGDTVHLFRFTAGAACAGLVLHAAGETDDDAVERLGARLAAGDPALLFADGLRCPAEGLTTRLSRHLDGQGQGRVPPLLAGGLASQSEPPVGPGARVFLDGEVVEAGCIAVVFAGVDAEVEVVRGWDPASPVFEVTRAEGPVLHEIGGEPAAEWFRNLFSLEGNERGDPPGPGTADLALPEMAHRFPLIVTGPKRSRQGLYRSMRLFDEPTGAVTFWGDLETGDKIRLGIGNQVSLVHRADELAESTLRDGPEAAVLYSCVGRQMVLGSDADKEVAAVHRALGRVPLSGFFSFGEIGPTVTAGPAFYNHTAILVCLSERDDRDGAAAHPGDGAG